MVKNKNSAIATILNHKKLSNGTKYLNFVLSIIKLPDQHLYKEPQVRRLLKHQQCSKQLGVEHLCSGAKESDPPPNEGPEECIADTFPHPGPLPAVCEPMSEKEFVIYF